MLLCDFYNVLSYVSGTNFRASIFLFLEIIPVSVKNLSFRDKFVIVDRNVICKTTKIKLKFKNLNNTWSTLPKISVNLKQLVRLDPRGKTRHRAVKSKYRNICRFSVSLH